MLEKKPITELGLTDIDELEILVKTATVITQLNAAIAVINTEIDLILEQSYGSATDFHSYISSRTKLRTDAQDAMNRLQVKQSR